MARLPLGGIIPSSIRVYQSAFVDMTYSTGVGARPGQSMAMPLMRLVLNRAKTNIKFSI